MAPPFHILTVPRYDRMARSLTKRHPEFSERQKETRLILTADPYNHYRSYDIEKLTSVPRGAGQYRLRLRRFRFRYDIYGDSVLLLDCALRAEDTYR